MSCVKNAQSLKQAHDYVSGTSSVPPGAIVRAENPARVNIDVTGERPKTQIDLQGRTPRDYNEQALRPAISTPENLPKGTILHGMSQSEFDRMLANGDMVATRTDEQGVYGPGVYAQVVTEPGVTGAAFRSGTEPLVMVRIRPERASAYTTTSPAFAARIQSPTNQIPIRDLEYFDPARGWVSLEPVYAYSDNAKNAFTRIAVDKLPSNVRQAGTTFSPQVYLEFASQERSLL